MKHSSERLAARWIAVALVYFVAGIGLGIFMAASHDFRLRALHVHLNLLGWVSMALFGIVYRLFPHAARSRLASIHFWLYQGAMPVMMAGLAGLLLGMQELEPVVALGSVAVGVAVAMFALAVWRRGDASAAHFDQVQAAT
jgi:hypothetical protein